MENCIIQSFENQLVTCISRLEIDFVQGEPAREILTAEMQKRSTYGLILYALSVTFAFVDLVISITPHWYSTIFGVYMFAGCVLIAFSVTSLLYMFLRKNGFFFGSNSY